MFRLFQAVSCFPVWLFVQMPLWQNCPVSNLNAKWHKHECVLLHIIPNRKKQSYCFSLLCMLFLYHIKQKCFKVLYFSCINGEVILFCFFFFIFRSTREMFLNAKGPFGLCPSFKVLLKVFVSHQCIIFCSMKWRREAFVSKLSTWKLLVSVLFGSSKHFWALQLKRLSMCSFMCLQTS